MGCRKGLRHSRMIPFYIETNYTNKTRNWRMGRETYSFLFNIHLTMVLYHSYMKNGGDKKKLIILVYTGCTNLVW